MRTADTTYLTGFGGCWNPACPGAKVPGGGTAEGNRLFINAVFWILCTGGMKAVIPPRRNRKQPRGYDKALYRHRHVVENAFLHLKRWRGIADAVRQKHRVIPGRRANTMHRHLGGYLVTTLASYDCVILLKRATQNDPSLAFE